MSFEHFHLPEAHRRCLLLFSDRVAEHIAVLTVEVGEPAVQDLSGSTGAIKGTAQSLGPDIHRR